MLVTQDKPKNPEDPRVIRTRALLVDALNELMGEKSFDAITVSEIAARATLNRVTFYAHFQDKYALLEYDMSSRIEAQLEAALGADPQLSDESLQALLGFVCDFLEVTERHCPPPRGQMQGLVEKQLKQHIYRVLLQALEQHPALKNGPSAQQTAMVSAWAIYGAAFQWSQQDPRQAKAQFTHEVLPLITANLTAYLEPHRPEAGRTAPGRGTAAGRGPSALLNMPLHFALHFSH